MYIRRDNTFSPAVARQEYHSATEIRHLPKTIVLRNILGGSFSDSMVRFQEEPFVSLIDSEIKI